MYVVQLKGRQRYAVQLRERWCLGWQAVATVVEERRMFVEWEFSVEDTADRRARQRRSIVLLVEHDFAWT